MSSLKRRALASGCLELTSQLLSFLSRSLKLNREAVSRLFSDIQPPLKDRVLPNRCRESSVLARELLCVAEELRQSVFNFSHFREKCAKSPCTRGFTLLARRTGHRGEKPPSRMRRRKGQVSRRCRTPENDAESHVPGHREGD